jgi:hypothetical protein
MKTQITIFSFLFCHIFLWCEIQAEKIKILDNEKHLSVYIFMDESSCITCNSYLESFVIKYINILEIDLKVFLKNASQDFINSMDTHEKVKQISIPDPFSIYYDFYKIKNSPTILIANNEGSELYRDEFAKAHNESEILKIIEENIGFIKSKDHAGEIEYNFSIGADAKVRYYNDKLYIYSNKFKQLYMSDTLGNILLERNIKELYSKSGLNYFFYFEVKNDSTLTFIDSDYNTNRMIFDYHLNSNEFIENTIFPKHTKTINYGYDLAITENHIIGAQHPVNNSGAMKGRGISPYFSFSIANKKIIQFGEWNPLYHNNNSVYGYDIKALEDDRGDIYLISSFTNELQVYKSDLTLKNEVVFDKLKYFKEFDGDLLGSQKREYYSQILSRISFVNHLLFNKTKTKILVSYYNKEYPDGIIDPYSDKLKFENFVVIYNLHSKSYEEFKIGKSRNLMPFYLENNIIWYSDVKAGNLKIYKKSLL